MTGAAGLPPAGPDGNGPDGNGPTPGGPTPGGPAPDVLGPPRRPAVVAAAVALPVALLGGVLFFAAGAQRGADEAPVPLAAVPAPGAGTPPCAAVADALPDRLGDYTRVPLAEPAPEAAAAWVGPTAEPVVLRCGVDRPVAFDRAAALTVVNGVDWFAVSGADVGVPATTWFAVDRGVYVALTLPDGSGPTPLQQVSDVLSATVGKQPPDPAPLAGP